jgi:hypothetical protein
VLLKSQDSERGESGPHLQASLHPLLPIINQALHLASGNGKSTASRSGHFKTENQI